MRYGIALPATLAIPYGAVAEVAVRLRGRRDGDISLRLRPGQTMGFARLWPHVRPWRLDAPEPMLRALPDAALAGPLLARTAAAGVARIAAQDAAAATSRAA